MKTYEEQIADAHRRLSKVTKESYLIRLESWSHEPIHPEEPVQAPRWTVSISGVVGAPFGIESTEGPELGPLVKGAVAFVNARLRNRRSYDRSRS